MSASTTKERYVNIIICFLTLLTNKRKVSYLDVLLDPSSVSGFVDWRLLKGRGARIGACMVLCVVAISKRVLVLSDSCSCI
jgi:hypothetical protein